MTILVIGRNGPHGPKLMTIDGHYDTTADVAWLRFEGYDPATAVPEKADYGFRELDIAHRKVVGLQYWQASLDLPADLLAMLPQPRAPLIDDRPTTHATRAAVAQAIATFREALGTA